MWIVRSSNFSGDPKALLRIDSSTRTEGSASRRLSTACVAAWKARHPHGTVTQRDRAVDTPAFASPEWGTPRRTPGPWQRPGAVALALDALSPDGQRP